MSEAPFDSEAVVRKHFTVLDTFAVEDGSKEYKVRYYDAGSKSAFRVLFSELYPNGYVPHLTGSRDDATLLVSRSPAVQKSSARLPVILVSLCILSVVATGWFLSAVYVRIAPRTPALFMAVGFIAGLGAILGVHELVHTLYSRRNGGLATRPYFIPNVPILPGIPVYSLLPTFGAVTLTRDAQVDKDSLFNLYFVGPIAGIAVALVVSVFGALTSVVLSASDFQRLFGQGSSLVTVSMNFSVLQTLVLRLTDLLGLTSTSRPSTYYLSSPVDIAAYVGFLITFFSLLPASPFDGGRLSGLILGERGRSILTAVTVVGLLVVDTPNYIVVALLIFLLSTIRPSVELLNNVSDVSRYKRVLFVVALLLILVVAPVPQNLATFPISFG